MAKKLICTTCLSQSGTKRHMKGSLLIELFLWLCFLVPGILYSVWRHTTVAQVCKACNSIELVPIDTPRGIELVNKSSTV